MQIRRIEIENFRSIKSLTWFPHGGLNLILGAGDSGKSTVLDAVALALSPQPSQAAVETDYRDMDTSSPFRIEVVLGALSEEFRARTYPPPLWGWSAIESRLYTAPNDESGFEPVTCIEVKGTPDLELQHRILQPGNDPRPMSVPARVAVGLWNVNTSRSSDAQLRMSRGSLLERSLGRDRMRAPAVAAMQSTAETLRIPDEAAITLKRLAGQLREAGIEIEELALTLVPSVGQSPVQLVTLVAKSREGYIPLANFGRGSQQIAMVTLAAAEVGDAPIAVIDEIEAGLEPYRQRALVALVRDLVADQGQAFVTSHSPAVLGRLRKGEAWRLRLYSSHSIHAIDGELDRLLHKDPEALLCRLPIVCEGATEVGILTAMFDKAGGDPSGFGVYLIDAGGHGQALSILAAFSKERTTSFGFIDNEHFASGKRAEVAESEFVHMYLAPGGRCIETAIAHALPLDSLQALVELPGTAGVFLKINDRLQAVSTRLGRQSRLPIEDLIAEHGEPAVREAIGESAAAAEWFKSVEAGRELGTFVAAKALPTHALMVSLVDLVSRTLAHVTPIQLVDK
jgi:putative ATP-dependent endonuclease of OLD family